MYQKTINETKKFYKKKVDNKEKPTLKKLEFRIYKKRTYQ